MEKLRHFNIKQSVRVKYKYKRINSNVVLAEHITLKKKVMSIHIKIYCVFHIQNNALSLKRPIDQCF